MTANEKSSNQLKYFVYIAVWLVKSHFPCDDGLNYNFDSWFALGTCYFPAVDKLKLCSPNWLHAGKSVTQYLMMPIPLNDYFNLAAISQYKISNKSVKLSKSECLLNYEWPQKWPNISTILHSACAMLLSQSSSIVPNGEFGTTINK